MTRGLGPKSSLPGGNSQGVGQPFEALIPVEEHSYPAG